MSNAIYFTRYTNELNMEQATVQMGVSSFVEDFGFTNSINYLVKETPFESGFQYVFHNLQPQKIEIENLSTSTNTAQNSLIKANEFAVFTTAKPKLFKNLIAELGLRINYYNSGTKIVFAFSTSYRFELLFGYEYTHFMLLITDKISI